LDPPPDSGREERGVPLALRHEFGSVKTISQYQFSQEEERGWPCEAQSTVLHFDETRAVEPLERTAEWEAGEVPETFPFTV
jgi:hypothetical protein